MQKPNGSRVRIAGISPNASLSKQGNSSSNNLSNVNFDSPRAVKSPEKKNISMNTTANLGPSQVIYTELWGTRKIKHKLDFDSPHTSQAAKMLGLAINDCLNRYLYEIKGKIGIKKIFLCQELLRR